MKPIINIKKGDAPVAQAVIDRAKPTYLRGQGWDATQRDDAINQMLARMNGQRANSPKFDAGIAALMPYETDLLHTYEINTFNAHLAEYRTATARLSRYVLAAGRPELTEQQETGEFDPETGEPITETVLVQSAIDPLPATVEVTEYAEDGTETVTTVPNPLIEQDAAERASAQAVIDATPEAVKAFEGN